MLLARNSGPKVFQSDSTGKRREQRLGVTSRRERGRSRTISPIGIALARHAAQAQALENAQRNMQDYSTKSPAAPYRRTSMTRQRQQAPPSSPAPNRAESSSMALRREQQEREASIVTYHPETPVHPASGLSLSRNTSQSAASPPRLRPAATCVSTCKTATRLWVEDPEDVERDDEPLPLPDQMHRAYAAGDMHTARVIFLVLHRGLRLQFGQPSPPATFESDLILHPSPKAVEQAAATILADDPRLVAVSEEDLSKVACGGLVVDEATLKELRDAERKDKTIQQHRQRVIRERKEIVRTQKQVESLGRGRSAERLSSPLVTKKYTVDLSRPVSFHEIRHSMQDPLFTESPDETIEATFSRRSRAQVELLESLLFPSTNDNHQPTRLLLSASAGTEAASLVKTDGSLAGSTIRRSNSWASNGSESTAATSICPSLASSPSQTTNGFPQGKQYELPNRRMPLFIKTARPHPSLSQLGVRSEPAFVARTDKPLKCEVIAISSSPLLLDHDLRDNLCRSTTLAKNPRRPKLWRKVSSVLQVLSATLFNITERISRSQLRSPTKNAWEDKRKHFDVLLPQGNRVSVDEVMAFAPPHRTPPGRELNFPSEYNIPLATVIVISPFSHQPLSLDTVYINGETTVPPSYPFHSSFYYPPRLGAVPHRSPLRPRSPPPSPECRLRPVTNPVLLRLKALQNILRQRGAVWEGCDSTNLNCFASGREKLLGLAYEGLGGSRLVFESR